VILYELAEPVTDGLASTNKGPGHADTCIAFVL
jgi:hypothetical protein